MRRRAAIAVAVGSAAALVAVPALASKGSTQSGSTAFPPNTKRSATATCAGNSHATGGGFQVTPPATPGATVQSFTTNSNFSGSKSWTATSGQTSSGTGTQLTAKVRCEKKSDGKIAILLTGGATITPDTTGPSFDATGQNLVFHCPPGTHPIAGGYQVAKPFEPTDSTSNKFFATQSRRTGKNWTVSGFLLGGPTATPADFTGTVPCEINGSRPLTEKSKVVPYPENGRATASATCAKGRHLVSGGFAFTPIGNGAVPVPFVDESIPATARTWTVSAYDSIFAVPPGSSLTTYAYCRKNAGKKHHHGHARRAGTSAAVSGHGWVEVTPAPPIKLG